MIRRVAGLVAILGGLTGCGGDSITGPAGFGSATATRICGPTDGPAVRLRFTKAAGLHSLSMPYLDVVVLRGVSSLGGQTWSLARGSLTGSAVLFSSADDYDVATEGMLTVSSVSADTTIVGTVDFRFAQGNRIAGGFSATWVHTDLQCI